MQTGEHENWHQGQMSHERAGREGYLRQGVKDGSSSCHDLNAKCEFSGSESFGYGPFLRRRLTRFGR